MSSVSEYGKLQREIRNEAKLSIRALSERSGVSHSYLSQVENGTRPTPSPEIISKIASALQYDYFTLMAAAGYMDAKNISLDVLHQQKKDFLKGVEGLEFARNALVTIERDPTSKDENTNEILDELAKVDEALDQAHKELRDIDEKIVKLKNNHDAYEIFIIDDEQVSKTKWTVSFDVPREEVTTTDEDKKTVRVIPLEEAQERFLYLENLLTMDENIYLDKKILSKNEKERALKILKLVFETDSNNKE